MIPKFKVYETRITNNSEEIQKITEFSDEYKDLIFELHPVEDRQRSYDTLIGYYKAKSGELEADVKFYENENGSWTIKASGFDLETNSNLEVTFDYDDFSDMIFNLKTVFLNLEENSPLSVWICKMEFQLASKDEEGNLIK